MSSRADRLTAARVAMQGVFYAHEGPSGITSGPLSASEQGPRTDAERARAHFNLTHEEWSKLTNAEKQALIDKLPQRGSAEDTVTLSKWRRDEKLRIMATYGHDASVTMSHLGIPEPAWRNLPDRAKDALVAQLKSLPYPDFTRRITWAMKIDSKIDGKDSLLVSGHRIVKRGDSEWDEAVQFVNSYAFDSETRAETIERSKRNIKEGRERLDRYLRERNQHIMLTGRYAPLYKGYKGNLKPKTLFLHDSAETTLHSLYVGNKKR